MDGRPAAINAALTRLLREARKQRGVSMDELARRAGVHRTYVGLLEREERQPTVAAAAALAEALDLCFSEVLAEAERQVEADGGATAPESGVSG